MTTQVDVTPVWKLLKEANDQGIALVLAPVRATKWCECNILTCLPGVSWEGAYTALLQLMLLDGRVFIRPDGFEEGVLHLSLIV